MKMKLRSALPSILFGCALFLVAGRANAAFIVNINQVGNDVVAIGAGTIDTAGLHYEFSDVPYSSISPDGAVLALGPGSRTVDIYDGISGPTNFGTGTGALSSSGSGDEIFLNGINEIVAVPAGYVSGTPLTSSDTFDNQTFASLGLTPGSYVYNFGTGATADSFTVNIEVQATPEPALGLPLAVLAGALLLHAARRRHTS